MTVFEKKVPANLVPAAAVIRGVQVVLILTGCKGPLGCYSCQKWNIRVNA